MPINVNSLKQERGITGLETAIILIAFVIVASVLSYVVISAGLFSSQKAKSAVNAGLAQVGATVELKGNVIAEMDVDTASVVNITFTVGVVPGGAPIDLSPNPVLEEGDPASANLLIISYQDNVQYIPSMYYTVQFINFNNGDNMLDPGELAMITVNMDSANYVGLMSESVKAGATFTLAITPPVGSVLPIERTLPSRVSGLVNLY
ncbi:MAG TPA: archaellin/type IV pilin N-terminal domain-containing protein [Dehalococcoidales bacterium]|nr:archaellin/type IV pilin N-terminal domain-containing protein [Dehalococcoidales bacterium]